MSDELNNTSNETLDMNALIENSGLLQRLEGIKVKHAKTEELVKELKELFKESKSLRKDYEKSKLEHGYLKKIKEGYNDFINAYRTKLVNENNDYLMKKLDILDKIYDMVT